MEQNTKNQNISISNGTIIRVILFGVFFLALVKLTNIILIILTSIVIASFIGFAANKMKKYIKNRTLAVFLIYFCSFAIVVGLLSVFVPVFIQEMSTLVSQLGKYIPDSSILNSFQPDTITGAQGVVTTISHNGSLGDVIKSTQDLVTSLSGGFFNIFGQAFGGVFNLLLIMVVSFYLSVTERGIENFLRIVTPANAEEYIIGLWQRTERKIGLWIQGQMLMGTIVGVLTYLGLTIIGVKYSLVLALLVVVAELVPFGLILAAIPGIIFAYIDGGVSIAAITVLMYTVIGQFETYLIYPLIVRRATGISPIVVIISLLVGGTLAGFWGVILAIPCAVCILEFLDDLEKKKVLARAS
jgi:predicted PurR-regulated permease PerM